MSDTDISTVFRDNLNRLLDQKGVAPSGFGRSQFLVNALGVGVATANKWLRGAQIPEMDRLDALRELLGCSFDDLLMSDQRQNHFVDPKTHQTLLHLMKPSSPGRIMLCPSTPEMVDKHNLYLLEATGDRMEPFVTAGDFVCFNPVETIDHDGVFVLYSGRHYIIRRVSLNTKGSALLISENPRYRRPEEIRLPLVPATDNDLQVVGIVLARILIGR